MVVPLPSPDDPPSTRVVPPPPPRASRVTPPTVLPPRTVLPPASPPPAAAETASIPRFRPAELLVMLRGPDPDDVVQNLARSFNLTVHEGTTLRLLGGVRVYRLTIPDNRAVEGLVAAIARMPGVSSAQPNFYSVLQGAAKQPSEDEPPDSTSPPSPKTDASSSSRPPLADAQYALKKLHVPEALKLARGKGVVVAVIDSAVDTTHPELRGANIEVLDAMAQGDNVFQPDDHGTAITGVIASRGELRGLAPDAKIIAVRAFAPEIPNAPPVTTSLALASAVNQAFAKGARVFNMSFAGPRDPLLIQMIDEFYAEGAVFLAAAGNNGPKAPPAFPAAHDKVIAITATDAKDGLYAYANRGKYISVAAPGVDILVPVTANGYDFLSGTSFAVAHVSGIVALMMEHDPNLKPGDVSRILMKTAHDLGPKGADERFGAGLADAYETLAQGVQAQR
ncbi:MAG: S8 family serine peptidase [Alphaproteobacteria bacterium]